MWRQFNPSPTRSCVTEAFSLQINPFFPTVSTCAVRETQSLGQHILEHSFENATVGKSMIKRLPNISVLSLQYSVVRFCQCNTVMIDNYVHIINYD